MWRLLNQSIDEKKVGLVGKELSHCSDHNEEATNPTASPCFPGCHPRHNVSQTAHGPAIPTTSAAWEPPQQTHHALKATNLTSKLRQTTPNLEATPSLTNLRLVLGTSAMTQTSLHPHTSTAQPVVLRVDVDRKLSTLPEAQLAQRSLGGKTFGPSPRPTQPFCSSSPWIDRKCCPEFGTLLGRPQASRTCSSTLGLRQPSRKLDMERTTLFNLSEPQ